jgi:hypothetical protein
MLVAFGAGFVKLLPLLEILEASPDRRGNYRDRRI